MGIKIDVIAHCDSCNVEMVDILCHRCRVDKSENRKPLLYLSGPMTGENITQNIRLALTIADNLTDLGFLVYVPHLSHLWDLTYPKPYEDWLLMDEDWIRQCDVIYRLDGASKGAEREVEFARSIGKRVISGLTSGSIFIKSWRLNNDFASE